MSESVLTVFSWNVQEKRTDNEGTVHWLFETFCDRPAVLCLQEVSAAFLDWLKVHNERYGFTLHFGLDKTRQMKNGEERDCHLVILANQEVKGTDDWIMSDTSKRRLLARFNIWWLRLFGLWDDTAMINGALSMDIVVGNRQFRVINAHLSLTSPKQRKAEFKTLLEREFEDGRIICGDMNVVQGVFGRGANLLVGLSIPYATYRSERREFDAVLETYMLKNPIAKTEEKTHKAGQIDHILVDRGAFLTSGSVYEDRRGSDHNPVEVELTILDR